MASPAQETEMTNIEQVIEEHFQEFLDKVAASVSEIFGEEPSQSDLYFGEYNRGFGTRIHIEDRFSVDLSCQHFSEDYDLDDRDIEEEGDEW